MNSKDILKRELEKRFENNDEAYEMIGAEIKRRRTSQAQTLSAVASDVCSVSYLCKVERNQLKPNRLMLKEICRKLNIESPKINVIFQMREFINLSVKHFINNAGSELDDIYDKCKHLDNYKAMIIKFINYLYHKRLSEANDIGLELLNLVNLMKDYELNVFVIFYSILMFYKENYIEALDNLLLIEDKEKDDLLVMLICYYIFSSYYKINHPLSVKYGDILYKYYFEKGDYFNIEKIRYYIGLYYVKNNMHDDVVKQIASLTNKLYKTSLKFIYNVINCKKTNVKIENLRPFMKLIYTYFYNHDEYRNLYHSFNNNEEYELDFSNNIANYLMLNTNVDKHRDLVNIYLPNACKSKNEFEQKFFLKRLGVLCLELGKYKNFVKAYLTTKEGE